MYQNVVKQDKSSTININILGEKCDFAIINFKILLSNGILFH